MAQHYIYLSTTVSNSVTISSTETELQKGDTVIFIALEGSFKVTFDNCLGLFEDDLSNVSATIAQGSKWETPIFRLDTSASLNYPFDYIVLVSSGRVTTSKGASKKIRAIVG